MSLIETLPVNQLIAFIYPNLYDLLSLAFINENVVESLEFGLVHLPTRLTLSFRRSINSNGLYLLDTGFYFFVLIGSDLDEQIIKLIFSVSSKNELMALEDVRFAELDNELSIRLRRFINYITHVRGSIVNTNVIYIRDFSGQQNESFVKSFMYEDQCESSLSIDEWLKYVHEEIHR